MRNILCFSHFATNPRGSRKSIRGCAELFPTYLRDIFSANLSGVVHEALQQGLETKRNELSVCHTLAGIDLAAFAGTG